MDDKYNVYRFAGHGHEPKIVVARDVTEASRKVDFDWETIKCVYKDITLAI